MHVKRGCPPSCSMTALLHEMMQEVCSKAVQNLWRDWIQIVPTQAPPKKGRRLSNKHSARVVRKWNPHDPHCCAKQAPGRVPPKPPKGNSLRTTAGASSATSFGALSSSQPTSWVRVLSSYVLCYRSPAPANLTCIPSLSRCCRSYYFYTRLLSRQSMRVILCGYFGRRKSFPQSRRHLDQTRARSPFVPGLYSRTTRRFFIRFVPSECVLCYLQPAFRKLLYTPPVTFQAQVDRPLPRPSEGRSVGALITPPITRNSRFSMPMHNTNTRKAKKDFPRHRAVSYFTLV